MNLIRTQGDAACFLSTAEASDELK